MIGDMTAVHQGDQGRATVLHSAGVTLIAQNNLEDCSCAFSLLTDVQTLLSQFAWSVER